MKKIHIKNIKTKDDARRIAIDWQYWQSTKALSFQDYIDWATYFEEIAKKFNLVTEFKENAII